LQASDFLPAFLVVSFLTFLSFFSFATLSGDAGAEVAGRGRPTAKANAEIPAAREL
jgi:hypothetical protein